MMAMCPGADFPTHSSYMPHTIMQPTQCTENTKSPTSTGLALMGHCLREAVYPHRAGKPNLAIVGTGTTRLLGRPR